MLTTKYALKKNVREWITLAVCVVSCLFGISMVTKVRVTRITCSPDPTTNSETKNSNFSFFDRFVRIYEEKSGFVDSGFGKNIP